MDPRDADRQRFARWLELQQEHDEADAQTVVAVDAAQARSMLEQLLVDDQDIPHEDDGETIVMDGSVARSLMNFDDEPTGLDEGETIVMDGHSAAALLDPMLEEDVTDLRTPRLEAGVVAWSDPTDTQPTLNEPYSDWATPQPAPPHPTPAPPPLPPASSPMLGFVVLAMAGFALGLGVVLSLIAVLLVF